MVPARLPFKNFCKPQEVAIYNQLLIRCCFDVDTYHNAIIFENQLNNASPIGKPFYAANCYNIKPLCLSQQSRNVLLLRAGYIQHMAFFKGNVWIFLNDLNRCYGFSFPAPCCLLLLNIMRKGR